MGDLSIAQSLLDGVESALESLGSTRQIEYYTKGVLDPLNPGAGIPKTSVQFNVECNIYDYKDDQIDGTNVLQGDRLVVISIKDLTADQLAAITVDNFLIDGAIRYTIKRIPIRPEVAGIPVTIIAQLRK